MTPVDRTDAVYGALTVLYAIEGGWRVRWSCCGREEDMAYNRVANIAKYGGPTRCRPCVLASEPPTAEARKNRDRRARRKAKAMQAKDSMRGWGLPITWNLSELKPNESTEIADERSPAVSNYVNLHLGVLRGLGVIC